MCEKKIKMKLNRLIPDSPQPKGSRESLDNNENL